MIKYLNSGFLVYAKDSDGAAGLAAHSPQAAF